MSKNDNHGKAIADLVKSVAGQSSTVTVNRIFIQLTGDPIAGMVLSEIIWGSDHTTNPDGWFYRKATEWESLFCLSYARVKRAVGILQKAGLVETTLMQASHRKADGTWARPAPTTHYRPLMDKITEAILEFLENRKSLNSEKRQIQILEFFQNPTTATDSTTDTTEQVPSEPGQADEKPPQPPTPVNLPEWLDGLRQEPNKQGYLVFMMETLYPHAQTENPYAFMAKVMRAVGGPEPMARQLWRFACNEPPLQEPLVYIAQVAKRNGKPQTARDGTKKAARTPSRKQRKGTDDDGRQPATVEELYRQGMQQAGFTIDNGQ